MQAGDVVLCHSRGLIAASIRFAQRHDKPNQFSKWNHVAVLSHQDSNGDWVVIQAEAHGVTNTHTLDSVAPGGTFQVVPLPANVNRELFLQFLNAQVGLDYGFLSIASCAVDMFIWDVICFRKNGTWICSGLVAVALLHAGFKPALYWTDLYTTTPAEIGEALSIVGQTTH